MYFQNQKEILSPPSKRDVDVSFEEINYMYMINNSNKLLQTRQYILFYVFPCLTPPPTQKATKGMCSVAGHCPVLGWRWHIAQRGRQGCAIFCTFF